MSRGRFIVFDGTDGSGKSTQLRLLAQRLRRAGRRVAVVDFPQYRTTFFGRFLKRFLTGEFGLAGDWNPYFASLAFAGDRWQARDRIDRLLEQGTTVLADRYASANMIHQGGKFRSRRERLRFLRWVQQLEFDVFRIPRPEVVLFFDLPPGLSRRLIHARGQADTADRDLRHQAASYETGRWLSRHLPHWRVIACSENGRVLPRTVIADRVWKMLSQR